VPVLCLIIFQSFPVNLDVLMIINIFAFSLSVLFTIFIIYFFFMVYSNLSGAPFILTSNARLSKVLELIKLPNGSKIAELGSGNGKVVATLTQKGYFVTGFEINPFLVLLANLKIRKLNLQNNCKIYWKSFWNVDLSSFDAIYVYGIPHIVDRLEKKIVTKCKSNTYIISIGFHFKNLIKISKGDGVTIYQKQ